MPRHPNVKCSLCSKEVYRRPGDKTISGNVFCSTSCANKSRIKLHPCPECNTEIRAGLNKKYCSRSCANKARKGISYFTGQHKSKHSTVVGYRRAIVELRGEICELCGWKEHPEILVVHHIIEKCNGGTNDLTNLKLICPNCHAYTHYGSDANG